MNKSFFLLILAGLLLAGTVSAQEDNGRGYWSLTDKKTFLIGERSNGDNTGIIGGRDGLAEFRLLHYIPSVFQRDGTFDVDNDGETTRVNVGGQHTPEQRNIHKLAVSWTRPSQYVKIGEEDKITSDITATFDGSPFSLELLSSDLPGGTHEGFEVEIAVSIVTEITVGSDTIGYSLLQQILSQSTSEDDMETYLERFIENSANAEEIEAIMDERYDDRNASAGWENSLQNAASGRLAIDDEWTQNLALGKESYMMVSVRTTLQSSNALNSSRYAIVQYYLYKNFSEGGDVDVDIRADDVWDWKDFKEVEGGDGGDGGDGRDGDDDDDDRRGGENEGTLLPPWVIPVAAGAAGAGGVALAGQRILRNRRRNGGNGGNGGEPGDGPDGGDPNDPGEDPTETENRLEDEHKREEEEKEEEEKEEEHSSYKMILYKECGHTLMVNDEPKLVGARIEEITAKGEKIDRPDLTAQIEIGQGKNITIVGTGTAGQYKAATVKVEQVPTDGVMEGDIWFTYRAPGGALRNRLIFNIEDGRIEFFQPNLTLPTGYKEEAKLPFRIHGASDKATVTVRVDTNEYKAKVCKGEKPEEKANNIWYAHITENHSAVPPKKDRKAGEYTVTHLEVEVKETNGHTIEGSEPIMRYNMGLIFECGPLIGCYAEPYNPQEHPFRVAYNGQAVCPAMNEATYCVMTWDEKEHQLRRVVPVDNSSKFEVLPLPPEANVKDDAADYESKKTRGMTDEEIIKGVGLQFYIKEILEDGSSVCCIYARGMLDAPARRKVRIHIETVYDKEKYEVERDVWLTSQPIRHFKGTSEELEALKLDDKMTDNLSHICQFIIDHDLLDRIGPVYRLAQMQLDAYDPRFGYDPAMTDLIRNTFLRYVRGETLGANAQAEGVEYMGLAAELLVAFAKTNRQLNSWLDAHGSVWTRLALGMATLGWSEPFMLGLRVADNMVQRANNPEPPGDWAKYFSVGVIEIGQVIGAGMKEVGEYLYWEKVMQLGGQLGGEFIATYRPDLASNVSRFAEEAAGRVKDKLGIFGKDVRELGKDLKTYVTDKIGKQMKNRLDTTKSLNSSASRSADDIIKKSRQNSQWTPEEILEDEAFRAANIQAMKDIKEMERACMDYIRYRTPETKAAFYEWCYKMQSNKIAQKQLAMYRSHWSNNLRSEYYRLLQEDYRIIDKEALGNVYKRLREQGVNVSEDDIYVFCATNSNESALFWGDTLTRDRDLTIMYKPKATKANPHPVPVEVSQDIAEKCYGDAYKKRTGLTMKEGDQAVVQKGSKEMIGAGEQDLNAAFKKDHFNEKFVDLDGVATAFEHKPAEWINEGARLRAAGNIKAAQACEEEGLRQAIKLYFNSMEQRATYKGTISRIKPQELQLFQVMKHLEVKTQDSLSLSIVEFKKILKSEFKMDITDVPKLMKNLVYRLEA